MSAKAKENKGRKRYSEDQKKEIIDFVSKHDTENGRGGKSAAVKKFGISPISLMAWIKANGNAPTPDKKRGRKPESKNAAAVISGGGNFTAKLKELAAVAAKIDKVQSNLDQLRKKFEELKASL